MNQIGRYKILKRLGGGGFGEVFLGEDPAIGRQVAIKVFKPKDENLIAFATSSDEEGLEILRARFLSEAKILASLHNVRHIVEVLEYGELDDGAPYYVMPYLPRSLSDELGRDVFDVKALEELPEQQRPRALPMDLSLEILEQVLHGLAAAHDRGLIHRDIKPSNIMLTEDDDVRIVDFGIAKAPDGQHSTVSHLGLGSRNYMAPEQRESAKHVDARADVYSIGRLAYRMLTGRLPVGRFADPNVAVPAIGKAMNDVILAALEEDREKRPAHAGELLQRFEAAKRGVGEQPGESDTGTWVGEGEAGIRDELKPLRAKIAERVGESGVLDHEARESLMALAAIAELDETDLERLIEDIVKNDKELSAKRRLALAIRSRVKARQGPLSETVQAGFAEAAEAVGWDRNKIKALMDEAVAELNQQDKPGSSSSSPGDTFANVKSRFRLPLKSIAAALVALVVLGGLGYGVYDWRQGQLAEAEAERQRQLTEQQEDAAWGEARGADTIDAYESFLGQWPDGLHQQAANERIAQLEESGQNTVARVQDYLNRLGYRVPEHGEVDTRTTESIRDFEQAQGLVVTGTADEVVLESLTEEYNRRDDEAWAQAGEQDSASAYRQYQQDFPSGRYIDQVDERIAATRDREAWAAAREVDTESAYRQYAEAFPKGEFIDEVEGAIARVQAEARRRELVANIQTELKRLGREVTVDGVAGQGTTVQIRAFERATDRTESGEPSESLLAAIEATDRWPAPQPGEAFQECPDCPEMVVIPAGSFRMGSPSGEADRQDNEGPQHNVSIPAFALATTEVTVGEFRRFVEATGYRTDAEKNAGGNDGCVAYKGGTEFDWIAGTSWRDMGFRQGDEHPVVCVSWNDAQSYVRWMSEQTGEDYRLPSETEQEYVRRARSTMAFPWGSSTDGACSHGNVADQSVADRFSSRTTEASTDGSYTTTIMRLKTVDCTDNQVFTAPVGSYRKNGFGLYDMTGNVWEWAQDCWNESYRGAPSDGSAWMSGDCGRAVLRGGSWLNGDQYLRSASRNRFDRVGRNVFTGFRPARSVAL
ncbi:SUMF1/EgtB/PvdO family nonheme iron enzyme [Wenzhouxiangella sp. EGI_FJ10305]|uniref:SUMF1/EgtB/PvdO family nonheme iron enzyme n=1 Tax=Wenzhouxiangella sp. EGI_FJ10305 TaxID=3243768 RepID=UPI0035D9D64A